MNEWMDGWMRICVYLIACIVSLCNIADAEHYNHSPAAQIEFKIDLAKCCARLIVDAAG